MNEYAKASHALAYLARADNLPHRTEGESVVLEILPRNVKRVLDLGTGDGRLLALLKLNHPQAEGIAIDFSSIMLTAARKRFAEDTTNSVSEHDLENPLPDLVTFDAIVSSFAIVNLRVYSFGFTPAKSANSRHLHRQSTSLKPICRNQVSCCSTVMH